MKEHIADENYKIRSLAADSRLDPDENNLHSKGKAPIDGVKFDKRLRLSEKVDGSEVFCCYLKLSIKLIY